MRSFVTVMALIGLIFMAGAPRSEVAPPADVREPVKLTLDECIALGIEQNPQLMVSRAQADQAKGQTMQAKAGKLPKVTLSANAVHSNMLTEFATGTPTYFSTGPSEASGLPSTPIHFHMLAFPGIEMTNTREGDVYGVKVEAQYALYAGGRIKNGIKAAELNERAAQEAVRQQRNELVFNIEQAFYGVLLTQEVVKVMDEAYATAAAHYRQVKAFYNEGLVSNLDVLNVESVMAGIRPQQIEAKNANELAKLGLKNLLNIDLSTPIEAVGELKYEAHDLPLPDDLYAQGLSDRPEMRIIVLRRDMAQKLLEISKAGAYPTVGLFANYQWNRGQELPPSDKIWRDGYQAGAALSVPLFDGRSTEGGVAQAQAQVTQVEQGKRALELGVKTQIQQAVLNLRSAEEKITAQQANVDAAGKNHEVAKARYAVGLASNLDVMDAQQKLSQAKVQYLSAVHDYDLAWFQLQAALGLPEQR
ncbi:MAG TPA: TolC family protein [bacterium]|nr:TolC family protein [bacterium]